MRLVISMWPRTPPPPRPLPSTYQSNHNMNKWLIYYKECFFNIKCHVALVKLQLRDTIPYSLQFFPGDLYIIVHVSTDSSTRNRQSSRQSGYTAKLLTQYPYASSPTCLWHALYLKEVNYLKVNILWLNSNEKHLIHFLYCNKKIYLYMIFKTLFYTKYHSPCTGSEKIRWIFSCWWITGITPSVLNECFKNSQ